MNGEERRSCPRSGHKGESLCSFQRNGPKNGVDRVKAGLHGGTKRPVLVRDAESVCLPDEPGGLYLSAHAVFAGIDRGAGLAVGLAAALGFALVPVLLAFSHSKFAFHPPIFEVEPGGDERMSLDLRLRK